MYDYMICVRETLQELEGTVNDALMKGYVCVGGVFIFALRPHSTELRFYQAMAKENE